MQTISSRPLRTRIRSVAAVALFGLGILAAPARAAELDLTGGVLSYRDVGIVANILSVSLTGGTYTIDDAAEAAINLSPSAVTEGCAPFDSNTITCPASAVASFFIATGNEPDVVSLSNLGRPAQVIGGRGNDVFVGGSEDDTYTWNPGDESDVIDAGTGTDTVVFNGSNISEAITINATASGFDVFRNVAAIHMQVQNAENLTLNTLAGADNVVTVPLPNTAQTITDGDDAQADVLTFDAGGLCPFPDSDTIEVVGRQPVQFAGFQTVQFATVVCGAIVDVNSGVLTYNASPNASPEVVNALRVSHAGSTYTIQDPGEAAVSITPGAFAQGCASVAPTTVTCPDAAVASFDIRTNNGDDSIDLTGIPAPARVDGSLGADTMVGGSMDDVFVWNPGGGNDVIDGGPGSDTLAFNGSNIGEIIAVVPDGAGFDVTRNVAAILLKADNIEDLELTTLAGADDVTTTNLVNTAQHITTGTDASPDTLHLDARGLCVARQGDSFVLEGRQPVSFAGFASVLVNNAFCRVDPCDTAVPTQGCTVNGVHNQPCEGTPGDDLIIATSGDDVIKGGGGKDRIRGGAGNDTLCGDEGDDLLVGSSGDDTLSGGPGADRLRGNSGNDILLGGDDDDLLVGSSGFDDLDGGRGDDDLRGGGDLDVLQGGLGVDDLNGGGGMQDRCEDVDQAGPFGKCEVP
jgi:Ca2+-binding RTX toxin-like protein